MLLLLLLWGRRRPSIYSRLPRGGTMLPCSLWIPHLLASAQRCHLLLPHSHTALRNLALRQLHTISHGTIALWPLDHGSHRFLPNALGVRARAPVDAFGGCVHAILGAHTRRKVSRLLLSLLLLLLLLCECVYLGDHAAHSRGCVIE